MAQTYISPQGQIVVPGSYPTWTVQASASGQAVAGVLFLVGEADAGPDYTLEADLSSNMFAPTQLAAVQSKYKSGRLVDAFAAMSAPMNDPAIQGSPTAFCLVKTNPSTKASANLSAVGSGTYATLYDKSYGQLGNLIYFSVAQAAPEVVPTTGAFTYIPAVGTIAGDLRVNGGAAEDFSLAANESPPSFVSDLSLSGVTVTGGVDRAIITAVSGTLALAVVSGRSVTITISSSWATKPSVGDTMVIPAGSVIEGGANQNVGAYVVTASGTSTISATKLSDAGKGGATPGTITSPVNVSATNVAATTDVEAYSPVTIAVSAGNPVAGIGKALEIFDSAGGTDLLNRTAYVLGTTTPVTWVSVAASPKLVTSSSEYSVTLLTNRQMDNVSNSETAGGDIALQVGYLGTTCVVAVSPTTLTTTVEGGSGGNLSIVLSQFPTIADLAAYIAAQPGYSAAVGSTSVGRMPATALDEGTFDAASDTAAMPLRLKVDAVDFFNAVSGDSLVQLGLTGLPPAPAGLPAVMSNTFLSGGTVGGTTDAIVNSALVALQAVQGNFLVPLISQDATADIAAGLTDSSSSYTVANAQAACKSHVLKMSTLKARRNRQAFVSNEGSFAAAEAAAGSMASFRVAVSFQDMKVQVPSGVVQEQPWMTAGMAAAGQAAGLAEPITNKVINCSGILQAAGDWKDSDDDDVEAALEAGLLIAKKDTDGSIFWVEDQTSYSTDSNFVFNSVQAVYIADQVSLTAAQRMQKAFVGKTSADISANLALTALQGIMADFLRLKWLAPSDDAPKGFKNAVITINGNVMMVSAEIKLATEIVFIPISFMITQVQQSASA